MFLTKEKLENRTQKLERFLYREMTSIAPLISMPATFNADEVCYAVPAVVEGSELQIGETFKGRDKYLWMRKKVTLPPSREDCQVVGLFNFGRIGGPSSSFESQLFVNGEAYQAVDANHRDVVFDNLAGQEVELTFLLWSGLGAAGAMQQPTLMISQAQVGYLHRSTDEFYYLSRAISETLKFLSDTDPNGYLLMATLDNAYKLINWDEDKFYATIDAALESLHDALTKVEKHSAITVNTVGHTHIDVAWLWRLKHTREKALRSFSTVLRLMEEFDDYLFLQTQPQLYSYIKQDDPAMYQKIRARIVEGRWEPDGGMWVEADCNIPSGEALVRQFSHGIAFYREEFGKECEYLWLPDVFGYSWALPQILKLCNIHTFFTMKISWNQYNTFPHDLFTWRGIDGSEVMAYFVTTPVPNRSFEDRAASYNAVMNPHSVLGSWHKFKDKALSNETLICYGYGDGGGGPNREMLKMRRAMDQLPGLPNVKNSSAREFFQRMHTLVQKADQYVHVWDGELYLEYHRGTYTSQAKNKRYNRFLEFAVSQSEWLNSLSSLLGGSYPKTALHDAWESVLLHQFHDIIPGSSIREVYLDSDKAYAATERAITALSAQALSELTLPEEHCFTFANYSSFARRELCFIPEVGEGVFRDEEGHILSAQKQNTGWLVLLEMQPLSLQTIVFEPSVVEASTELCHEVFKVDLAASVVETPFYRLEWNDQGHLTRIFDKQQQREVLAGAANVFEIYEDMPLKFDNWDIDLFHLQKCEHVAAAGAPLLVEQGTERCILRFHYIYNQSTIGQDVILYRESRRIDFETHVDWHEANRLLKVAFTVDIRATKATYDIQFGHVERPTHFNTSWDWARFEVVGHKWADLSETGYGVSLLSDCKYGYSVKDNIMRLSLLKSSKYPDAECDMGTHSFTYALWPHARAVTEGGTIEEALRLNVPLAGIPGRRQDSRQLFKIDSDAVIVDAVKRADREDCLVLRLHECRGGRAKLHISSEFGIKAHAFCNLLEDNLSSVIEGETITIDINPFEIKTVKIWFTR